jgi:hypothetical protein
MYAGPMLRVAPLLIFAIGCSRSGTPPLTVTAFEIRDDHDAPVRVVLTVTNRSRIAVPIDAVVLATAGKSVLHKPDFADRVPPDFDCRLVLLDDGKPLDDGTSLDVPAGESVEIVAELQWQLAADPPPMLAIVQANFAPAYRGEPWVYTELAAFVVQSRAGALDLVVDSVAGNRENDRKLLELLDQHTGVPSPGFTALRNQLRDGDTR